MVIRIKKPVPVEDTTSVCARVPCVAWVEIKNVSSCGTAFSSPIHVTDTIEVNFVFSLAPTLSVFPLIKPSFPGLLPGNIFEAYLEQRIALGDEVNYRIYGYSVR